MPENKYIYIGASIRGASTDEKVIIKGHVRTVCDILDNAGYRYYADKSMTDATINKLNPKIEIPRKYYENISDSLIEKITGLRADSDTAKLRNDIAMLRWTTALLESSAACVWLIDRSWIGAGIEIYKAIFELNRQCLVLYSTPSITSLLNGVTSRLLTIRRWSDGGVEKYLSDFLKKVERQYDHSLRFQVSADMLNYLEKQAKEHETTRVDYIREVLGRDREMNG